MTEKLGRFGHHPDPAIDFCIEVEEIEAIHADQALGLRDVDDLIDGRIAKAMLFRVGGDIGAVSAKNILRNIEAERVAA